jgi:hypothetical protein
MMRRSRIGLVAPLAAGCPGVASAAGAATGVEATLTRTAQPGPPDARAAIAWKLRDAAGGVFSTHVFVRITCPEGDAPT